jgi:type VI secretion system protein VasI
MIPSDSIPRFCAVLLLSTAVPSFAQPIPGDLLNCKNLANDADRLACFDQAMTKDRTQPASTSKVESVAVDEKPEKPKSKWYARKDTSAMTDDTNHFVSTTSIGYHQCSQFGTSGPITLWVRCMEDTTALIISGDCHLASGFDGYGEVTWRTDDDKAVTRSFEASTNNQSLGLWSGGRSIPAVKELFGKERLVVRFTPFSMSPVEATFDITGLEEAIGPLRQECGW